MEKRRGKRRTVSSSPSTRTVQAPADVLSTSKSKEQEKRGANELPRQQEQRVSVSSSEAKQTPFYRTHFAQRCDQVTLDHETPATELTQRYDNLLGHGDEQGGEVREARARSEKRVAKSGRVDSSWRLRKIPPPVRRSFLQRS